MSGLVRKIHRLLSSSGWAPTSRISSDMLATGMLSDKPAGNRGIGFNLRLRHASSRRREWRLDRFSACSTRASGRARSCAVEPFGRNRPSASSRRCWRTCGRGLGETGLGDSQRDREAGDRSAAAPSGTSGRRTMVARGVPIPGAQNRGTCWVNRVAVWRVATTTSALSDGPVRVKHWDRAGRGHDGPWTDELPPAAGSCPLSARGNRSAC